MFSLNVLAPPDLVDLAQQAQVEASQQAQVVDYQLAQVADYQLVLAAASPLVPVVDFLPGRAEASLQALAEGFQQAPVAGHRLAPVVGYPLAPVVDYQQGLATIGAVCLALIMAGRMSNRSNILRNSLSGGKNRRTRRCTLTARGAGLLPVALCGVSGACCNR